MIADEHEYKITCYWAKRFQKVIDEFDDSPREGVDPRLIQAELEGLKSQHATLLEEIEEYKRLKADPTAKSREKPKSNFNPVAAYCQRGQRRLGKGDLDGAIADFDEAIRLKPDYEEAIRSRDSALAEKAHTQSANKTTPPSARHPLLKG